jgi:hypothetical protein
VPVPGTSAVPVAIVVGNRTEVAVGRLPIIAAAVVVFRDHPSVLPVALVMTEESVDRPESPVAFRVVPSSAEAAGSIPATRVPDTGDEGPEPPCT